VSKEELDENKLKSQILDFLNTRFLTYQIGSIENPLRELVLRSPNKKYVIEVKFSKETTPPQSPSLRGKPSESEAGGAKEFSSIYFSYSFKSMRFKISKSESHANESYWANDLHDVLNGKQEMFSTFLHKLEK
jgi:hypothetical protein